MSKRSARAAILVVLLVGTPVWAGSPTMSTSPVFPVATCGPPEDICIPAIDVFANLAPTVPPLPLAGFFGLARGDDITGLS